MKKLMMALVAVAFGCAAQAATVNWSTTKIQQISDAAGSMSGAPIKSGYTAILTIIGDGGTEIKSTGNGWASSAVSLTTIDSSSLTVGVTGYAYTLVIEGTVTDSSKNYADAIGKTATLTYSGTFDMNGQGETSLSITPTDAKWTYSSVPEPTSGLLLLLGVAGMALRRRRA